MINFNNFLHFILQESSKSLEQDLNHTTETMASILGTSIIHIGASFLAQNWRVISASHPSSAQGHAVQRLITAPLEDVTNKNFIVIDVCKITSQKEWQLLIDTIETNKQYDNILAQSRNYILYGILEGSHLVTQEFNCDDTFMLPMGVNGQIRILWKIE